MSCGRQVSHSGQPNSPIDTSSAAGKAFLDMLGVFAEFEANQPKTPPPQTSASN